jgi:hypothetical protein
MARDFDIIIPARNEMFLRQTIENILENIEANTGIIAICDGNWPEPPIDDHPRVTLIYHSASVGQRAATNEGVRISDAKFIMKADAHCAFDKGFDRKLMENFEYNWTVVPRMYNLHAFDWKCNNCGNQTYQGPTPTKCEKCDNTNDFERVMVWQPRMSRRSDFARFDKDLHFQYWSAYEKRPEAKDDIADLMCHVGACWSMHRDRYWELGGMDEAHGSWGQMGVEVSCKTWFSGGRQVVNKKTWFSHMFRTQGGDFGFPYKMSEKDVDKARKYSRKLWQGGEWPLAKYDLNWLLEKFKPIPDWHEEKKTKEKKLTKGVIYYTDNSCDESILTLVQKQLKKCIKDYELISVSQKPIDFGKNIVVDYPRGSISIFKQIYDGLLKSKADVIFLVEHDVLYHPSHFDYVPKRKDRFYYNQNRYQFGWKTGQCVFRLTKCTSHLVAYREYLIKYFEELLKIIEEKGYSRNKMGFAPGTHKYFNKYKTRVYMSEYPNVDIRHDNNWSHTRWNPEEFHDKHAIREWKEVNEIPGWGKTEDILKNYVE